MKTLGLELSTQSGKAVIIDADSGQVTHKVTINFDESFPEYHTVNGVLVNSQNPEVRETSPLLLLDAFERLFEILKSDGVNFSEVKGIKANAMQHCTVYMKKGFDNRLSTLESNVSLKKQLENSFSRKNSPIWEDRSTAVEASALEDALQIYGGTAAITGNRAELRFPAAQIMKWAKNGPTEYNDTAHIQLLSAFITSLLSQQIAPVDTGDGFGTNLNGLSLNNPSWDNRIIKVIEEYSSVKRLLEKLGTIVPFDQRVGQIGKYFVERFGFTPDTIVLAGTGDNPATLMGSGGEAVISLGSSYTVNGIAAKVINKDQESCNVFGFAHNRAIALSCFTNGGKIHEKFLNLYAKGDWHLYSKLCGSIELSPDEPLMLPYLFDESVPRKKAGIIRSGFSESDAKVNVRALHISQVLSLIIHSSHLAGIKSIAIAGGGAKNSFLRQLISDFFQCETFCLQDESYTAAIGCAISATSKQFIRRNENTVLKPSKNSQSIRLKLIERYKQLENLNL